MKYYKFIQMTSKCSICQSSFRKYWTISCPCLHNLHYKCMQILIECQSEQKILCPICREEIIGYRVVYKGKYRRYYIIGSQTEDKQRKQIAIDDYYEIKPNEKREIESNHNLTRNQKKLRRRRQLKRHNKKSGKCNHLTNKSFNPFLKRHYHKFN